MQQIVSRNAVASGRAGSEVRLNGGDINGANQWDDITTTDWEDRIIASRAINKAVEILRAHEDILAPSKSPSLVDARFITTLSSISRNDEDAARMHRELGAAYMEMGRWSQAIGELRKVAGHPGLQAEARCLIARCLTATARHEEAVRELRQALNAFPAGSDESIAVLYDMARAYESMKDAAQSLQCLLQIRKIRPGYRDVDQRIRAITRLDSEFLHGLLRRAEKELNTVLKHAPIHIFFLDPDGRIRKASRSACLASGRAEDQVLGRLFGDVLGCCYAPCHIYASGSDSACGCCRLLKILRDTFGMKAAAG
jgi:tetratricopeptide (TPR) repeat protein